LSNGTNLFLFRFLNDFQNRITGTTSKIKLNTCRWSMLVQDMLILPNGNFCWRKWILLISREWGTNMNRDSLASHLGHHSRMVYFAVAENQSLARMKYNFVMVFSSFPQLLTFERIWSDHAEPHLRKKKKTCKRFSDPNVKGNKIYPDWFSDVGLRFNTMGNIENFFSLWFVFMWCWVEKKREYLSIFYNKMQYSWIVVILFCSFYVTKTLSQPFDSKIICRFLFFWAYISWNFSREEEEKENQSLILCILMSPTRGI